MSNFNQLESSDLNQNIQINTDTNNKRTVQVAVPVEKKNNEPENFVQNQKQRIANNMVQSASEQITKSWYEKCICGLEFLKKYFNVTTADVRSRLLHSLVPFNPKFYDISEQTPDLYGPFWIYTTLIFIIAAAGSLAGYLQDISSQNFFQEFVPIAAGIIYGIGFGLPIIMTVLMKCFGSETSFISVLCIYGYSYTIFIPIVIACIAPIQITQWILLAYGVFHSTSFILVNYWKEMGKYIEKKRLILLVIIILFQVGLFLLLKLYFFEKFNSEANIPISEANNATTDASAVVNATVPTNSTLLL